MLAALVGFALLTLVMVVLNRILAWLDDQDRERRSAMLDEYFRTHPYEEWKDRLYK
jgi:hypothetical protein